MYKRQVIDINLTGQFLCSRAAAREFLRRGVVPELSRVAGKIICISSVHDVIPWAGHVNYATAKGGVSMLMKTMAQELAPQRIRVNAISPGAIKTPINTAAWMTPEAEAEPVSYTHLAPQEIERMQSALLKAILLQATLLSKLYVKEGFW